MNKTFLSKPMTAFIAAVLIYGLSFAGIVSAAPPEHVKIRICHATDSHNNPYTNPEVDQDAVDGDLGNDHGQGDHYMEHTGPVWAPGIADHSWGDIIPPIPGVHDGLNWTDAGQAIWNNACNIALATPTPTPSSSPTPTPTATPEPTPTPTPNDQNNNDPFSVLSSLDVSCGRSEFTSVMELQQPQGTLRSGVNVHFTFQGQSKSAITNNEGRAIVYFGRQNGTLTAQADNFPSQSLYVTAPTNCPENPSGDNGTGGGNQIADVSTSSSSSGSSSSSYSNNRTQGQVLGATTLANTGSGLSTVMAALALSLPLVIALYAYQKISQ
jgi:hypothetical protein